MFLGGMIVNDALVQHLASVFGNKTLLNQGGYFCSGLVLRRISVKSVDEFLQNFWKGLAMSNKQSIIFWWFV